MLKSLFKSLYPIITLFVIGFTSPFFGQLKGAMVAIDSGFYTPIYNNPDYKNGVVKVSAFYMDIYPVTNNDFLEFVKTKKGDKWKKSKIPRLFVDKGYLNKWENDILIGSKTLKKAPVTNISWYAANKYCEWQGKRLPTTDEWEYVAMANAHKPNALKDSTYVRKILAWYETSGRTEHEVGQNTPNYYGVHDIIGLVWEWTNDFNAVVISGDSRKKGGLNKRLFCAGGFLEASDRLDYAGFARYSFRGSLAANYAIKNLGFRCAKDKPNYK